jgi:hypothetical protein
VTDTAAVQSIAPRMHAKARREFRKAEILERNPQAVEAMLAGALALEKMCRHHGVAPATIDKKRVTQRMSIDACSARIVIEVR